MKLGRKGQAGLEYLMILGFLLVVVGVMYAFSLVSLNDAVKMNSADKAARTIVAGADLVAAYGPGNKLIIEADFPNGIESAIIDSNAVMFSVQAGVSSTDIVYLAKAPLKSTVFSTSQGKHTILVEVVDGEVNFTEV